MLLLDWYFGGFFKSRSFFVETASAFSWLSLFFFCPFLCSLKFMVTVLVCYEDIITGNMVKWPSSFRPLGDSRNRNNSFHATFVSKKNFWLFVFYIVFYQPLNKEITYATQKEDYKDCSLLVQRI